MASTFRFCFFGATCAALIACGSGGEPSNGEGLERAGSDVRADTVPRYPEETKYPDRSASWMSHGASTIKRLLYVSDHKSNDVYVYDFKTGKEVGKLTGFHNPSGQCVDAAGDVWIANYSGSSVVEYAHGGGTILKKFRTDGHSIGCSIGPQGDLSVANVTTPNGAGDIQLWRNASGHATSYSNEKFCYYLWPPGDDPDGNMFVETNAATYACELYYGGSQGLMQGNSVFGDYRHTINFPGSVMWDGQYLAFTDQEYGGGHATGIYQAMEVPSGGLMVVGTTILTDRCHGTEVASLQPFIVGEANTPVNKSQGTLVVGSNLACPHRFDYWSYPTGGGPTKVLSAAPEEPEGAAVSIATSQ